MESATEQRRAAFSIWLRTGRVSGSHNSASHERKFNPWHDRRDGRFTFAGGGRFFAAGDSGSFSGRRQSAGNTVSSNTRQLKAPQARIVFKPDSTMPRLNTVEEVNAWAAAMLKEHGNERGFPEAIEAQRQIYLRNLPRPIEPSPSPPRNALRKMTDFASGYGEGVYDVGAGAAKELYSLATTNPVTSVQNIESGIAQSIDGAIAAEDTPAYVQIERAGRAIRKASAHDLGYALGSVSGNVALAVAPGTIVNKVSAIRQAVAVGRADRWRRMSKVGNVVKAEVPKVNSAKAENPPDVRHAAKIENTSTAAHIAKSENTLEKSNAPKIQWVDDSIGREGPPKDYNDSATGARSNITTRRAQVPALERTMADGKKRRVRFDGLEGEHLTDRKWSIYMTKKAKNQAIRQSEALRQNDLTGIWQVPNAIQKRRAVKLLEELEILNIKVEVVKP